MEKALEKMRGRSTAKLLSTLEKTPKAARGLLVTFASGAYTDGSLAGFYVHGSYLGAKDKDLTQGRLKNWIDRGQNFGEFAVGRLEELVDTGSSFPLTRWAGLVGEAGVWRGQDDSALELGREYEVEWKTWVRVWARSEHRGWHDTLEGLTIPVDDFFSLPGGKNAGAKVYGPRDWDKLPRVGEWVNCGHALTFSKTATAADIRRNRTARVNTGELETLYAPTGTPAVPDARMDQFQWSQAKPGDLTRDPVGENLELATRAWKQLGVTARVDPIRWREVVGVPPQENRDRPVFYDVDTDSLLLNQHSGLWSAPESFARKQLGYGAEDNPAWIIWHEHSHALAYRANARIAKAYLKTGQRFRPFENKAFAEVSPYAIQNRLEFFAEAYAGFKTGKRYTGQVKRVFEAMLALFEATP